MQKRALVFTILCSFLSAFSQKSTDERLLNLDTEIQELLETYHTAGLSVAVVENGKTIYVKGFGYRDIERQLPVDENTVFGIGSVSKAFIASLLGMLETDGELSLTDRPREYIPELKFQNSTMDESIQIRNLLCHNTGLSIVETESSCALFASQEINDLVPRLAHLVPAANVGERFLYCNAMYTLAAIVSERVTGKTWQKQLEEKIFQPLGMTNTYPSYQAATKNENLSKGYAVLENRPKLVPPEELPTRAPSGDIFSSANDMVKWLKLWMNEGRKDSVQILSESYITQATGAQQIMGGAPQESNSSQAQFVNYGYGWMSRDLQGYYKVEHSGGVSGYGSNVAFFPTENIGIVVLTNQFLSSLAFNVTNRIEDRLLNIKRLTQDSVETRFGTFIPIAPTPDTVQMNQEQQPTHPLENFVGRYQHDGFGEVTVSLEKGNLYAQLPFTKLRLGHRHYNVFNSNYIEEVPLVMTSSWLQFNFVSSFQGVIDGLEINIGEEESITFERINND
ncbi:MAG: serine hydrolase [Bacteroidota bacterium]